MVSGNTSYDGTDIPIDTRALIQFNKARRELSERVLNIFIEGTKFWHDMYKKRMEKYMELRNSLMDINEG